MRHVWAIGLAGVTLAGCAMPPVRDPAIVSQEGYFRGPVIARRDVPVSARYEGLCESRAWRWDRGWYRVYGPCPQPLLVAPPTYPVRVLKY